MKITAGYELGKLLAENRGKRLEDIAKIPGFDKLIKKEIKAYNFRKDYQKKDLPNLFYSDFKRQFERGMTKKDFEKTWLNKFNEYYKIQPPKEQYKQKGKRTTGGIPKMKKLSPKTKFKNAYEEALEDFKSRGLYTDQYIDKNKAIYEDFFDAIQQFNQLNLQKQGDINVRLQYVKQLEKLEYNPNLIERETIRLKNIIDNPKIIDIDGKKIFEADLGTYLAGQEKTNKTKENELREAVLNLLKTENPTLLREAHDMTYDELFDLYKDIVGNKWKNENNSLQSPDYFKKEMKTEEDIKEMLKDNDVDDIIQLALKDNDLKTDVYIDNFMRAIRKDMDNNNLYRPGELNEIEDLINLIPKHRRKWVFLDDRIELEEWYSKDPEEVFYDQTKGEYLIKKLKEVIKDDLDYWNIPEEQKKEILNRLK